MVAAAKVYPLHLGQISAEFFFDCIKRTIKGVEAELSLEPVDGLQLDASAALLDFKYDSLTGCSPSLDPSCPSASGGLGAGIRYGMDLPFAAERQFSAGAQYTIDFGSVLQANDKDGDSAPLKT